MPVREGPPQPAPPPLGRMRAVQTPVIDPAEHDRGAAGLLRKPWQRMVFFSGLLGAIALAWFL